MVNNLSYLNLTGIILPILNMKEKAKLFLVKRRLLEMAYSDRRYFFFVGKPTQVLNIFLVQYFICYICRPFCSLGTIIANSQ